MFCNITFVMADPAEEVASSVRPLDSLMSRPFLCKKDEQEVFCCAFATWACKHLLLVDFSLIRKKLNAYWRKNLDISKSLSNQPSLPWYLELEY